MKKVFILGIYFVTLMGSLSFAQSSFQIRSLGLLANECVEQMDKSAFDRQRILTSLDYYAKNNSDYPAEIVRNYIGTGNYEIWLSYGSVLGEDVLDFLMFMHFTSIKIGTLCDVKTGTLDAVQDKFMIVYNQMKQQL
ncbi:MAG: hypothetical protein LBU51_07025 [Bacteroidales bacterium]|jgi:hypothetical protein|nr:hypothetical protein [Bacteroidales bacterium]